MEWFIKVLRNYAVFDGRARRKEFWMFVLFNIIIGIVISIIDNILGTTYKVDSFLGANTIKIGILNSIYSLGLLIPSIAVSIRRLHDLGKSGWYYLLVFIPLIGSIWLIILFATQGNSGENAFGPDPKEDPQA